MKKLRLNAPTKIVFLISVIAFIVGLVGTFIAIPIVSGIAFWLVVGSFVLLALSTILKGL